MSRFPLFLSVAACLLGAASGCERVSYWSGTTESDTDPLDGAAGGATAGPSTGAGVSVDEAAVLRSAATCASELYGALATATSQLALAANTSVSTGDDADSDAARESWRVAMDVWEQAEAVRVGPLGPAALPGGSGGRDEIYAWPMTNRCLVEQTLVSQAFADVDFGDFSLVNVRGLGAAEYLLFYGGTDNACAPTTSINETGAWDALSEDDLRARKRAYAAAAAAALDLRARQVDAAWRSDGEDFAARFAASGSEGAAFATTHVAIQALFDGVIVGIRQLRDDKVARPFADAGCDDASCDRVEAPFAHVSARLARRQLAGLARVLGGCASGGGLGLDDLLVSVGRQDVATRATDALETASASFDAIEGDDLVVALRDDRDAVAAALAAVTALAEVLEVEVAPSLGLDIAAVN